MKHYLVCEHMWTLAVSACALPASFLPLSAIERLCIFNKSRSGLKLLSVVFRGYHALMFDQRSLIDSCLANDNFEDILLLFVRMCREFWLFR